MMLQNNTLPPTVQILHSAQTNSVLPPLYGAPSLRRPRGLGLGMAHAAAGAGKQQILLRLSGDLAERLAQVVAPRQRSRYILDLLSRDLDRERNQLGQAAQQLNALEAQNPDFAREGAQWLQASLETDVDDDFDATVFEQQYRAAQEQKNQPQTV